MLYIEWKIGNRNGKMVIGLSHYDIQKQLYFSIFDTERNFKEVGND